MRGCREKTRTFRKPLGVLSNCLEKRDSRVRGPGLGPGRSIGKIPEGLLSSFILGPVTLLCLASVFPPVTAGWHYCPVLLLLFLLMVVVSMLARRKIYP